MWIQTELGELINTDHVRNISISDKVQEKPGLHCVVAMWAQADQAGNTGLIIKSFKLIESAKAALDHLFQELVLNTQLTSVQ